MISDSRLDKSRHAKTTNRRERGQAGRWTKFRMLSLGVLGELLGLYTTLIDNQTPREEDSDVVEQL
jgi:hypothetical protein